MSMPVFPSHPPHSFGLTSNQARPSRTSAAHNVADSLLHVNGTVRRGDSHIHNRGCPIDLNRRGRIHHATAEASQQDGDNALGKNFSGGRAHNEGEAANVFHGKSFFANHEKIKRMGKERLGQHLYFTPSRASCRFSDLLFVFVTPTQHSFLPQTSLRLDCVAVAFVWLFRLNGRRR